MSKVSIIKTPIKQPFAFSANTSGLSSTDARQALSRLLHETSRVQATAGILNTFIGFSHDTGGYVQFHRELSCLPVLIGDDLRPVLLYEFVEILDGLVDYNEIKEAFPTLSYAQIGGAISFLRKVVQTNASGIDIDGLEDEADANDVELMNALRTALTNGEPPRVLNNSE